MLLQMIYDINMETILNNKAHGVTLPFMSQMPIQQSTSNKAYILLLAIIAFILRVLSKCKYGEFPQMNEIIWVVELHKNVKKYKVISKFW